jgi:hypothetical protein
MRYFNTSGPCLPELHYMLPPEPRLPGALELIEQGRYFVVHAPRQTGKTTTLNALAQDLTATGRYVALLFSCERAEPTEDDYGAAGAAILDAIAAEAFAQGLAAELMPPSPWPEAAPESRLHAGLATWSRTCPLPIVLFFDEIDALRGLSLISVLRQLRDGFRSRPASFPSSVVLCGLRDVRDYKAASGGDPQRLGTASPFNVSVKSFRMGDFTGEQVADLYAQHAAETGQEFTPAAAEQAFAYTQGQPWLVNALAWEITGEMRIKPPVPVTAGHVDEAKERLILARATHLDSLAARLHEPRVRRFVEPLLAGGQVAADPAYNDDLSYVRDLGLIAQSGPVQIANPIYKEVIVRVLNSWARGAVTAEPRSFLLPDGRLDFAKILAEFAAFWREHGEMLVRGDTYHEVAPQLVFVAFLQRVVNGGGFVDCEYGVGRGRIDVLVRKPYTSADGSPQVQREVVELKVRRQHQANPVKEGLAQLDEYLSRLGLDTGTLLIFDRRPTSARKQPNPELTRTRTPAGREVTLLSA